MELELFICHMRFGDFNRERDRRAARSDQRFSICSLLVQVESPKAKITTTTTMTTTVVTQLCSYRHCHQY
jgi:hypothetical protein